MSATILLAVVRVHVFLKAESVNPDVPSSITSSVKVLRDGNSSHRYFFFIAASPWYGALVRLSEKLWLICQTLLLSSLPILVRIASQNETAALCPARVVVTENSSAIANNHAVLVSDAVIFPLAHIASLPLTKTRDLALLIMLLLPVYRSLRTW